MRILVIALLKESQVRYKLEPLSMSPTVERLYLIRKSPGPAIPKLEYLLLPFVCKWRPFYLIMAPLYAIFFAWTKKVDFILAYHLIPHGVFAFIASLVTGKPFIYSQIDMDIQNYTRNKFLKKLIVVFLKKAAFINVPGSNSKKFWINLGISEEKINILHSTIDTENGFFPTNGEKDYDFIYVGELSPRKRVDLVIAAIKKLIDLGDNAKLAIIGDGPSKAELMEQVKRLNISNRVFFLGYQKHIRHFLNRSRIFVLISENEGLPCALMEAMSCGLLAVASNVSDIPDVLIDGETGFIVDEEQPDSVFQVLRMAWERYEDSYSIRRKSRDKIIAEHSYQAAVNKWSVVLKKMRVIVKK